MKVIHDSQNDVQIDLKTMEANIKTFQVIYDEAEDVFYARPNPPRPATSLDWEGEIWVRVHPETGEVVGLEIDDFESVFLKKHPDLAKAWQEIRPICCRKRTTKHDSESWEAFLRIVQAFFNDFFKDNPTQSAFGIS